MNTANMNMGTSLVDRPVTCAWFEGFDHTGNYVDNASFHHSVVSSWLLHQFERGTLMYFIVVQVGR